MDDQADTNDDAPDPGSSEEDLEGAQEPTGDAASDDPGSSEDESSDDESGDDDSGDDDSGDDESSDDNGSDDGDDRPNVFKRAIGGAMRRARNANSSEGLYSAARSLRERLPGDPQFGDPLSTAEQRGSDVAAKRLADLSDEKPGVLRELGLGALQVFQAASEAQGRGRGEEEFAIIFTDLVEFSEWALDAGDEAALQLLRDVASVLEPAVEKQNGRIVKRLGDGMMAVCPEAKGALDALLEARPGLTEIECDGYVPRIRAGVHVGRPRKLGGDYLGVDVTIAARLAEMADADQLIVSQRALEEADTTDLVVEEVGTISIKGVPRDLAAYRVDAEGSEFGDGDGESAATAGS